MDFFPPFDQIGVTPSPGPWQNANPSAGQRGSIVNAAVFPAVQTEILNVQDAAGLTRDAADFTQILRAIRSGVLQFYADTGTADAMAITPSPTFSTIPAGTEFCVLKNNTANATTVPTLVVNGLAQTIVKRDGSALLIGDLPANGLVMLRSDGTHFRVQVLTKSDVSFYVATSPVARSFVTFGSSTTWTVPPGVYFIFVRIWGGGGGAGGASSGAAAAGAGAGGYAEGWYAVTPGQVLTITVGAGGAGGGAGLNGNNGGSSSVGSLVSATAGLSSGGAVSGASSAYGAAGQGYGGSTGVSLGGFAGAFGTYNGTFYVGGVGGGAFSSTGPSVSGSNSTGGGGGFPGGGGGGGANNGAGGAGVAGLVLLQY